MTEIKVFLIIFSVVLTPALWFPVTLWTTWWEPNAKRWRCIKTGRSARRCWSVTTAAAVMSSSWASSRPRPILWWCYFAGKRWQGSGLEHTQTSAHKSCVFCQVCPWGQHGTSMLPTTHHYPLSNTSTSVVLHLIPFYPERILPHVMHFLLDTIGI